MAIIHRGTAPNLSAKLRAFAYQDAAVEAIRDLEFAGVFHEQGLGKTKIAIDVLLHWLAQDYVDSVLIVTKKGLVANWEREFRMHTSLRPRVFTGDRRADHATFHTTSRVYIAHYELGKVEEQLLDRFARFRRVGVILDESQKIKNPSAALTQAYFRLRSAFDRRLILTGTPVANRPFDIWAQIYFLDSGNALGENYEEFRRDLDLPHIDAENDNGARQDGSETETSVRTEEALRTVFPRLSAFCVRETKDSGVLELPEKVFLTTTVQAAPRQAALYAEVRDHMQATVTQNGEIRTDDAEAVLKRLLRLVQIASNPRLVDEAYTEAPGKLGPLLEILRRIAAANEKAIVWTSFVDNVSWLAAELGDFSPVRVHGRMRVADRERSLRRFMEHGDTKVLIATPAAAKEGLTLTVANHAIFYDRSFSLDDYSQAQDRIHRISQIRKCYVYNLSMADTVDDWVDALLQAKRAAARLAQGDSSVAEFRHEMRYDWRDILRQILEQRFA